MKRHHLYILAALLLAVSCAGRLTRPGSAQDELLNAADILKKDRNQFTELNSISYPGNGYFYILSSEGVIMRHPEKALEGASFKNYDFVKRITDEKNGCISYNAGSRRINIFFMELKDGDILCFTFESSSAVKTYTECNSGSGEQKNE